MPNAISVVGTAPVASSQTARTISINPTTVGNLIILGIIVESATAGLAPTAVSGGNCTGWTQLVSFGYTAEGDQISLWMAQASATGATNATVTTTAGSTIWVDLIWRQYTCVGVSAGTQWLVDGTPTSRTNTSNTNITYPTLAPSGASRMYLGYGVGHNSSTTANQTSGYTVVLDDIDNALIHNASVSTSQTPTSRQASAGVSAALAALIYAEDAAPTNDFMSFFS